MNKRREVVDRYNTFKRNPLFLESEDAKGLSAVIYYNHQNTYQNIRDNGDVIINDSATIKLEDEIKLELKNILFKWSTSCFRDEDIKYKPDSGFQNNCDERSFSKYTRRKRYDKTFRLYP